jgi:hypothetical protein
LSGANTDTQVAITKAKKLQEKLQGKTSGKIENTEGKVKYSALEGRALQQQIKGKLNTGIKSGNQKTYQQIEASERRLQLLIQQSEMSGAKQSAKTRNQIQESKYHLAQQMSQNQKEVLMDAQHNKSKILAQQAEATTKLLVNQEKIRKEIEVNKHKARTDLALTESRLSLTAQANAKDAELKIIQMQYCISKQQEECCCEIKELISSSAGATQALLAAQEAQYLRDKIADLRSQGACCDRGCGGGGERGGNGGH